MRKVKIVGMDGNAINFKFAKFHQWVFGTSHEGDFECYAVVEFEDGSVRVLVYDRIIFVKD